MTAIRAQCISLVLLLLAGILLSSCKKNPAGPEPPRPPDTTSHAVLWQIDSLGTAQTNNNVVFDIAFINDTLIYAGGQFYLTDSTGAVDWQPYPLAVWNGSRWRYRRFTFTDPNPAFPPGNLTEVRGILAFGARDVWFAAGSIFHWDGLSDQVELKFSRLSLPGHQGSIERLWGTSSSTVYGVGDGGIFLIPTGGGGSWQLVPTGTDMSLLDIQGTSTNNVWIAGTDMSTGQRSVLLHWDGQTLSTVYTYNPAIQGARKDTITGQVMSVWVPEASTVWINAQGKVYKAEATLRAGEAELLWTPPYVIGWTNRLRGSGTNNVFVVGDFATILHYNGSTWHHYTEFMDLSGSALLRSLVVQKDKVFVVGSTNGKAIVMRGKIG